MCVTRARKSEGMDCGRGRASRGPCRGEARRRPAPGLCAPVARPGSGRSPVAGGVAAGCKLVAPSDEPGTKKQPGVTRLPAPRVAFARKKLFRHLREWSPLASRFLSLPVAVTNLDDDPGGREAGFRKLREKVVENGFKSAAKPPVRRGRALSGCA